MLVCNNIIRESDLTSRDPKVNNKVLTVKCDLLISDKCMGTFRKKRKSIAIERSLNSGKDICTSCFNELKDENIPEQSNRYEFDSSFFKTIDSEYKAYALGLIAGGIFFIGKEISIKLNYFDNHLIQDIIPAFGVKFQSEKYDYLSGFTISSANTIDDICGHLKIKTGDRCHQVCFPDLNEVSLKWAFVRGLVDVMGDIVQVPMNLEVSQKMRTSIEDLFGASFDSSPLNSLDFLGKVYEDARIYLASKHDVYLDLAALQPSVNRRPRPLGELLEDPLNGKAGRDEYFTYALAHENAKAPFKERISDSGYDLTVVEKVKEGPGWELWNTGVKVKPAEGWYFDMVPRSSMSKRGYILANSVGIIDRAYTGPIMAAFKKTEPDAEDIKPGERLVQIIPRPIVHFKFELVEELDETVRGAGGFGSTG